MRRPEAGHPPTHETAAAAAPVVYQAGPASLETDDERK